LLVWDKDSYTERFPSTCVLKPKLIHLSDLFTTSQSPSHSDLCHFKVTIFSSSTVGTSNTFKLGFLPFPIPPVCARPLVCDPCPIILLHLF
jgi:hypothetical protein